MYIPTNKELSDNINEKFIDIMAELIFVAESESYEVKSSFRLIDRFDRLDKCSYGALLNFSYYCRNVSKYYKNPKAKELLKQVVNDINKFLDAYECYLH